MDWLTLVAIAIAAGCFVFAVVMDRKNVSALRYLYELINSLVDGAKDKPE